MGIKSPASGGYRRRDADAREEAGRLAIQAQIAALGSAIEDVRARPAARVPAHLRDAHYPGAAELGHGEGYRYPHDAPGGWLPQEHRPSEVADRQYYRPTGHGDDVPSHPGHEATGASDNEEDAG